VFGESVFAPFFAARAFSVEPVVIARDEFRDLKAGVSYFPAGTLFCMSCGSMTCSARPNHDSMVRYYSGYQQEEFLEMRMHYEPSFKSRFLGRVSPNTLRKHGEKVTYTRKLEDFIQNHCEIPPKRILDIGGGSGANTPFNMSADVEILEIDDEIGSRATEVKSEYDLVTLLNVLEHVRNPIDLLEKAKRYCNREDSYIFVEVPLEGIMIGLTDVNAAVRKKKIWTEHINFFSKNGLEVCLNRAGFDLVAPIELLEISDGDTSDLDKSFAMLALAK
jgi:2-polyprenyl-3-methyl-5-hydroxy-6-metoxy-1,4-benzoquinol methylase